MPVLRQSRAVRVLLVPMVLASGLAAGLSGGARPATESQPQNVYTIFTPEGRRSLPFRSAGGTEMVPLEQVVELFGLATAEDSALNGLTITARGQRVIVIAGQSLAQVAGRVVSLSGPVQRDRGAWHVPIDFLSSALGPALGVRIEVRRAARIVLVGDVRVPQVSARFERAGANGRLVIDIQPATPHRVSREGNRLIVRFEASALDVRSMTGFAPEFVTGGHAEGTALVFDLGPWAASFQADADRDQARLAIDLLPAQPSGTPPSQTEVPSQPPPTFELPAAGTIRTVVIDPGHGGDDEGARGRAGAKEKDITLQAAQRLKIAIEGRIGLRVLLTRDGDENIPLDRRTALANNNKADLFLSLHVNASVRPDVRGAQVLSLAVAEYTTRGGSRGGGTGVPLLGGGTRVIEAVPWDLAQLPFASRSAALGSIFLRRLAERGVPLHSKPAAQLPLRVLVGANMPALLVEMGFLSNTQDAQALASGQLSAAIVDAIVTAVTEIRRGLPDPDPRTSPR